MCYTWTQPVPACDKHVLSCKNLENLNDWDHDEQHKTAGSLAVADHLSPA